MLSRVPAFSLICFHAWCACAIYCPLVSRRRPFPFYYEVKGKGVWPHCRMGGITANIRARCVNVLRKALSEPRLTQCAKSKYDSALDNVCREALSFPYLTYRIAQSASMMEILKFYVQCICRQLKNTTNENIHTCLLPMLTMTTISVQVCDHQVFVTIEHLCTFLNYARTSPLLSIDWSIFE